MFSVLKAALFLACLAPAVAMAARIFLSDSPPENPVEYLTRESGELALQFMVITLAMTPLNLFFGWGAPLKLRRMFGLYAFFYAFCHFEVYLLLDLQLDIFLIAEDILERKYITVGFVAFLLLVPLAITSNKFSIRRLGAKQWVVLHRAVYAAGILGAVHFLWLEKGDDLGEPLGYLAAIIALLAVRIPAVRERIKKARR